MIKKQYCNTVFLTGQTTCTKLISLYVKTVVIRTFKKNIAAHFTYNTRKKGKYHSFSCQSDFTKLIYVPQNKNKKTHVKHYLHYLTLLVTASSIFLHRDCLPNRKFISIMCILGICVSVYVCFCMRVYAFICVYKCVLSCILSLVCVCVFSDCVKYLPSSVA